MFRIKKSPLYRLSFFVSKKRKIEFSLLILMLILNGIFESFSIGAMIPFILIISQKDDLSSIPIAGKLLSYLGVNDFSTSLLIITILFLVFVILSTFLRVFNIKYTYKLAANLEIELSKFIFKNNILQPYINYKEKNSSKMITITVDKVSKTASAFCSFLILIGNCILGLFIIGSLIFINWKIVFTGLIFLGIYYLIIYRKVGNTLANNGKILASNSTQRLRILQEVFYGFRDVIVNGTEKIYIEAFNKIDSEFKYKGASTKFISAFPRYLIEGLVVFILVIVGYHFSLKDINLLSIIPILGSFIYAFQKLLPLIQQIYYTWSNYKSNYANISDVIEEIDSFKNVKKNLPNKNNLTFKKNIKFQKIFFAYDRNRYILKDLNFIINKGDHIGIYGQTGSGKSTLIDILIGLLPPTKGEIFIDGVEIYKKKASLRWTSKIAHVSQNIFLKEGSIAENIAFGETSKNINYELLVKASKSAHIYDFIKKTPRGFETKVGERGINLSGGQRQRIAIARALYRDRDILVLDEATSALDQITEEKIIESLKRNKNLTIFMVSHRLKSLEICNRVFKVEENKLIEVNNDFF